jgi:hypothetical protein
VRIPLIFAYFGSKVNPMDTKALDVFLGAAAETTPPEDVGSIISS